MNPALHPVRSLVAFFGWLLAAISGPAANVDYFADNGYGNPVSTIQYPSGEHFQGVTYVAYQGPHEDPYVAAYVHATGQWIGPVQAGVSPLGKSPDQIDPTELDNHGKPALVVDRQGYIHLIFGAHGGDPSWGENKFGTPLRGRFTHVVSQKPGDITAWKTLDNVSPFGTYSQWVKPASGDLYLFYRHGSHKSDWVYQKSTDDGRTFSAPVSVLKHKVSAASSTVHDSWYAWFGLGQGDTITASYVYHPCAGRVGDSQHTSHRQNAYYMKFDTRTGQWSNVQGDRLALPVTKEAADKLTLIEATGAMKNSHGTTHLDSTGHPHAVFPGVQGVRYFRWDGKAWQKPVAVGSGAMNDGDFIVDSPLAVRMILGRSHEGQNETGWWNTTDGGLTWTQGATLIASREMSFIPSTMVRNAHPDAVMLVAESNKALPHLYRRMFLVGAHGPLGRPAAEASHLGDRLEQIKSLPPPSAAKAEAKKKKKAGLGDDEP